MDEKAIRETTAEIMRDFPCRECKGERLNLYATGSKLCYGCGGTGKDRDRRKREKVRSEEA